MPTYDYKCENCGIVFTEFHGINEKLSTCKECGGSLERLISGGSGVSFRGAGWRKPKEYIIREAIERGKSERQQAAALSRNPDPYGGSNSFNSEPTDGLG